MVKDNEGFPAGLGDPVEPRIDAHGLADIVVLKQGDPRESGREDDIGPELQETRAEIPVR